MIRKSTKLTSLILAATTVASMVPAMAADKIADKDGTLYYGVAYKEGKFLLSGDEIEGDEEGVFYLDNGTMKEVEELDSNDEITGTYSDKYVEIEDGDYYLNLETGEVVEDNLQEEAEEDAASELRKAVRKDKPSRYTEDSVKEIANVDIEDKDDAEIFEVPAPKYTTPYYETRYLTLEENGDVFDYSGDRNNSGKIFATVYTDAEGNYIDADNNLGKINLIIKTTDDAAQAFVIDPEERTSNYESVSFSSVGTEENRKENLDINMSLGHVKTLGSDAENIYRLIALKIKATPKDGEATIIKEAAFGSTKNPVFLKADDKDCFYAVQKISKKQGNDDKDDAMLPDSTQTYFTTDYKDFRSKEKGFTFESESSDKYDTIGDRNILSFAENENKNFTVADGKITAYDVFENNGSHTNGASEDFNINTWGLKSTNGFYYIGSDSDSSEYEDSDEFAVDVDKEGNVWKLDSGRIYKYTNDGDYKEMYRCDGGLNELSVYDDENLVAFNEDDEVFAIKGGKSSTGNEIVEDEDSTDSQVSVGWFQNADSSWSYGKADGTRTIGWLQSPASGLWYFMDANGVMMANGWIQEGGNWYFLKDSGAMATGWVQVQGTWYFLNNSGVMQTGWVQSPYSGKWYYLNASGAMVTNTVIGGYTIGADGAWIQ